MATSRRPGKARSGQPARAQPSFADLSGTDTAADDALLSSVSDVIRAVEPLLSSPALLDERVGVLRRTYQRWRRRPPPSLPAVQQSEVRGALGFCLFTQRVLQHTRSGPLTGERWHRLHRELGTRFGPPEVKAVFARLYDFPEDEYDLDSAEVHRIGTTSFILRCLPAPGRAAPTAALKCLLYPYTRLESLAGVTRDYATRYGRDASRPCPQMVEVYRSTACWVLMKFVDGPTLLEVLQATAGEGLRADRLMRYGLPLVRALRAVPSAHLDLSPSNILVEDDSATSGAARLVLIDFGENYLLTQNVAGGSVLAETTRYVAPELLGSRALGRSPTGYEDVYSLGQILLEIAGYGGAEGGYLPGGLFMDAPLVGRLIEDLLDRSPDNRLLLSRLPLGQSLADQRREVYAELTARLEDALKAHTALAGPAPTLSPRRASGSRWYQRAWAWLAGTVEGPAQMQSMAGDLPVDKLLARTRDLSALKFLKFWQVMRDAGGLAAEFRPFYRWALLCSAGLVVIWALILKPLWDDVQHLPLHPFPLGWPAGWQEVAIRLVVLTFGLTCTRYYLEIFSMLTLTSVRRTLGVLAARVLMRLMAVGGVAIVLLYLLLDRLTRGFISSNWLLYWGVAMGFIFANNLASYRVAQSFVSTGERVFSTIGLSDLHGSVDAFGEWWRLMLAYGGVLCLFDGLIALGLARDVIPYAILVMLVNILALYRGNCGRKAPGLRATLARAYLTGQRLAARERRLSARGGQDGRGIWPPASNHTIVPPTTPSSTLTTTTPTNTPSSGVR